MLVLEEFKPCRKPNSQDTYDVDNYYGVSYYKRKKDNKHLISLIYDYSGAKNQLKGNCIELDTIDEAIAVIALMDEFSEDKSISKKVKFDFNNVKDYKSDVKTTEAISLHHKISPFI
jgi:hypothetical protein